MLATGMLVVKGWAVALDLINKISAHHFLNQLKMLMPGPEDSSLQTEKVASVNSLLRAAGGPVWRASCPGAGTDSIRTRSNN